MTVLVRWAVLLAFLALSPAALAQTTCPTASQATPGFTGGGSLWGRISAQVNQYFATKVDANNGTLCNPTVVGGVNGLGLGTMSKQNSNAIAITGGTVTGTSFTGDTLTGNTITGGLITGVDPLVTTAVLTAGPCTVNVTAIVWKPNTPASVTCTLPAVPATSERHVFADQLTAADAFAVTIAANAGQTILTPNGAGTSFVLTNPSSEVTMRYVGSNQWIVE